MDQPEPYFEWVPEDIGFTSQEEIIGYALGRVEAQWNDDGWNQPFAVGCIFQSHMAELEASALSACVVPLPPQVVEDPEQIVLFAQLVTQAVYQQEYRDDDFQRLLMLAAIGHPDQDLDGPRQWMRHVMERGGQPIGWFSVAEGFNGDVPENVLELDDDQIRALPGVQEVRSLTFLSRDKYTMYVQRVRGQDTVEFTKVDKVEDAMGFALGLLTTASLRMRIILDAELAQG